jgi:hypothetical protein
LETLAKYNFKITYKKGTENAKANALSKRSNFIRKTDKKKTLFKEGDSSLEYSSKIAIVFKVIKNLTIKQQIKDAYLRDTSIQHAKAEKQEANRGKLMFMLNKTGLI